MISTTSPLVRPASQLRARGREVVCRPKARNLRLHPIGDGSREVQKFQANELLLKVIAYNITCMVHSIFELGVTVPGISTETQSALAAHGV